MILSACFDVSLHRRHPVLRRLSPCWRPASTVHLRALPALDGYHQVPEAVIVSWLLWQLRISLKIKSIAAI